MGLLDKLKDLFIDEITEDDEIELEEENKEVYEQPKDVLPKVMRDTIKADEAELNQTSKLDLKLGAADLPKPNPPKPELRENTSKFTFPIDFETDYVPQRSNNVNVLTVEKEKVKEKKEKPVEHPKTSTLYPKKETPKEKPKFKASPVISPVYGILDKNYKKEEVTVKDDTAVVMKRPSKKVDFETVRKKAFGNLTDDLRDSLMCENCELYKEAKRISSLKEDDLLYDMTVDESAPVTIEKAYDNYEEFGVAYENPHPVKTEEPTNNLDSLIVNHNEEPTTGELIEIKETNSPQQEAVTLPSREEKNKDINEVVKEVNKDEVKEKVDSDFFELIDSMYKERVDE